MAKTTASKKTTTKAKTTASAKASALARQRAAHQPPTHQPGQSVRVTITKLINRAAARKTVERLFLKDRTHSDPLDARSANFIPLPKRRGGQIWTKRVNKVHPPLATGDSATIKATPQAMRDLNSVKDFVEVGAA